MHQERWGSQACWGRVVVKGALPPTAPHLKVKGSPANLPESGLCFSSIHHPQLRGSQIHRIHSLFPSFGSTWETPLGASKPPRPCAPVVSSLTALPLARPCQCGRAACLPLTRMFWRLVPPSVANSRVPANHSMRFSKNAAPGNNRETVCGLRGGHMRPLWIFHLSVFLST